MGYEWRAGLRSAPQLNTLEGNPVQRGRDYADPPGTARHKRAGWCRLEEDKRGTGFGGEM